MGMGISKDDEKFLVSRKAATRGSLGLSFFAMTVLIVCWVLLFWFLPQYLNPMYFFDGILDRSVQPETVNFFAGLGVILFHVVWLLLLILVFATTRGLRREQRLLSIVKQLENSVVSSTGQSGSWKLE